MTKDEFMIQKDNWDQRLETIIIEMGQLTDPRGLKFMAYPMPMIKAYEEAMAHASMHYWSKGNNPIETNDSPNSCDFNKLKL